MQPDTTNASKCIRTVAYVGIMQLMQQYMSNAAAQSDAQSVRQLFGGTSVSGLGAQSSSSFAGPSVPEPTPTQRSHYNYVDLRHHKLCTAPSGGKLNARV